MGTGVWSTVRERQRTGAGQSTRTPEGTGRGGGAEHAHAGRNRARGWETDARYECDVGAVHAHGAHVVVPP